MIQDTIKKLHNIKTKSSKLFIIILSNNENSTKGCIVLLKKSLPFETRISIGMSSKEILDLSSIICKSINDLFVNLNGEKLIKLSDYIVDFCKNDVLETDSIKKFFQDFDLLFETNLTDTIMSFKKK